MITVSHWMHLEIVRYLAATDPAYLRELEAAA